MRVEQETRLTVILSENSRVLARQILAYGIQICPDLLIQNS
jgi:hypothetical protein